MDLIYFKHCNITKSSQFPCFKTVNHLNLKTFQYYNDVQCLIIVEYPYMVNHSVPLICTKIKKCFILVQMSEKMLFFMLFN